MRDPAHAIYREAERKLERAIDEIEKNPSVNSARASALAKSAFEMGVETGQKMAEAREKVNT